VQNWGVRKVCPGRCHDLANWLSHYLYFFSFLFFSFLIYNYKMERGKVSHDFVTMSQWCDGWSHMVMSQVTVTVGHMMRVTWGPWESKRIATVVKCISSREMSENSIEFSLSNSEQRDSWLNSGHWTLDADSRHTYCYIFNTNYQSSCHSLMNDNEWELDSLHLDMSEA